ncbi:MAG: hypothetical protein WHS65_07165 [Melioribacteraceae bacterium]
MINKYENYFMSIVFGPIPSRRLGRSLGIINIHIRDFLYSCFYFRFGASHVIDKIKLLKLIMNNYLKK